MLRSIRLILLVASVVQVTAAEFRLPSANQGHWRPGIEVGVSGGIDQYRPGGAKARTRLVDVTKPPYNADKTGTNNTGAAIQAALDASRAEDVIYFPAGTYKITSPIYIDRLDSFKTLRGEGAGTVFNCSMTNSSQSAFMMQYADPYNYVSQTVTGIKTKGIAALSVANSSAYAVGDLVVLSVENEENNTRIQAGSAPTWSSSGFPNLRQVFSKVTGVSAGVVTVDPPLCWDCTNFTTTISTSELSSRINRRIGFEDFTVIFDNAAHSYMFIETGSADECWFYNINAPAWKRNTSSGSIIFLQGGYRCEIRKCRFDSEAAYSDDGAIQIVGSSSCLIVDNIAVGFDSGIYNSGKTYNNAFIYNYLECDGNYPGHNGHNSLDLWEGNICRNIHFDGFHGSNSHMTVFRNWLYQGVFIKRFMYYITSAGNVMGRPGVADGGNSYGNPNIGNGAYTGTANAFVGDFHADWLLTGTLTTRTSDTEGVVTLDSIGGMETTSGASGNGAGSRLITLRWSGGTSRYQMTMPARSGTVLTVSGGSGAVLPAQGTRFDRIFTFAPGFQELDLGVAYTMTETDNWLALAAGGGSMEGETADTLPPSLAYTGKPAYFGDLEWPPVNSKNPRFSDEIIPAGYRYRRGVEPPGVPTGASVRPSRMKPPVQTQ